MYKEFLDAKTIISSAIPVIGALFAVYFAHLLHKWRENTIDKNNKAEIGRNLVVEVETNYEWMNLAKTALEVRFGSILKGILNFKSIIGFNSIVFDRHADNLLTILSKDTDLVKAIFDVYSVCKIIDKYFQTSEDKYYQREQFFLMNHLQIQKLQNYSFNRRKGAQMLPEIANKQTEALTRFQSSELIPLYLEHCVAMEVTNRIIAGEETFKFTDEEKRNIANKSIERLRSIFDVIISRLDIENEHMAEIARKTVNLDYPFNNENQDKFTAD